MPRALLACVLALVVGGLGAGEHRLSGTERGGSPSVERRAYLRLDYTYDEAKRLGIPVPAIPPAAELCDSAPDDGFDGYTLEELDALDSETGPPCTADPRLGLYSVGYSVEAVRDAPTAYLKGRIICAWNQLSPGQELRGGPRSMLTAPGVKPTDDVDELVRGCTSTWKTGADRRSSSPSL